MDIKAGTLVSMKKDSICGKIKKDDVCIIIGYNKDNDLFFLKYGSLYLPCGREDFKKFIY